MSTVCSCPEKPFEHKESAEGISYSLPPPPETFFSSEASSACNISTSCSRASAFGGAAKLPRRIEPVTFQGNGPHKAGHGDALEVFIIQPFVERHDGMPDIRGR